MGQSETRYSRTIGDDASPFEEAIGRGLARPLILWGHPGIGQAALLEAAAAAASLPYRTVEPEQFDSWEGFRDISDSGHFRELSLEKFLARGERGDPETFALASDQVLHLRDLNLTPTKLVQAVFDQVLDDHKLLNNPLPDGVRIVASCRPPDRHARLDLLGGHLRKAWDECADPPSAGYAVFPLPSRLIAACDHWAIHPSLRRFVTWGRGKGLAEEVLHFLEEEADQDLDRATALLHANLLHKADLFPQIASPRGFSDLGSLLVERRLYFSSRTVRDKIARATSAADFQQWLHAHASTWDADRWIEADSSLTVRGEPVSGSVWLRHMCDQIRNGQARVSLEDLVTYAAYERRSLEMWATQELGDDLGKVFVLRTAISAADVARLRSS